MIQQELPHLRRYLYYPGDTHNTPFQQAVRYYNYIWRHRGNQEAAAFWRHALKEFGLWA